jgi:hypothetical protein
MLYEEDTGYNMAHFAKIENGIVTNVIVAEQEFIDSGAVGNPTSWVQTSYNGNIRKRFAGIGYAYNQELDAFIPPKPFNSWILDTDLASWKAPIEYPNDGKNYIWDEDALSWSESSNVLPGI